MQLFLNFVLRFGLSFVYFASVLWVGATYAYLSGDNKDYSSYQWDIYFDRITLEHGLNQGSIYSVITDPRGFTWIGTQDGLHFFDGNKITLVSLSDTKVPKFRFIRALKIIGSKLFVATHDGLVMLDLDNGEKQYYYPKVGDVYQIEQVNKDIWLAGDDGVEVINQQLEVVFTIDAKNDICVNNLTELANCQGLVRTVLYQKDIDTVWLGTSIGLFSYHLSSQKLARLNYYSAALKAPYNLEVRALILDHDKNLWVGTDCGLFQKPSTEVNLVPIDSCIKPKQLLTSTTIQSLAIDNGHNLWVGNAAGITKLDLNQEPIVGHIIKPHSANPHGLTDGYIRSLHTDERGRIWIGTNNGLNVTNIERLKINSFRAPTDSQIGNYVYSFLAENNNSLYISSNKGLSIFDKQNPEMVIPVVSNETVFDTEKLAEYIWAAGRGSLYQVSIESKQVINIFDSSNSPLDGRYIYKLSSDTEGNLWLGTSYGLYRFNYSTDTWTYWNTHNGLVDSEIYELKWIKQNLWIGTQNGISVFDVNNNQFTNYNQDNSALSSKWIFDINHLNNTIYIASGGGIYEFKNNKFNYLPIVDGNTYSVLPILESTLLITTNNGLKAYQTSSKSLVELNATNGLASNEFNYNAHNLYAEHIYLGTTTGFSIVPSSYLQDKLQKNNSKQSLSASSYITQATIDGVNYDMWQKSPISAESLISTELVSINWDISRAQLNLSNPYYGLPAYEKYNTSALALNTNARRFTLTPDSFNLDNLSAGEYNLKLRHDKNLQITINPHFLLGNTAKALYFITLVAILFFLIRVYFLKKYTEKLKAKNNLIKQQHQAINAHLKFKEHIFYQIQHSLKSPLSASRGLVYLLEQQIQQENYEQESLLRKTQKLKNAQTKLNELIEQILIISQSQNTKTSQSIQNITNVVAELMPIMLELAEQKGIKLNLVTDTLKADASASTIDMGIFIIFENIISNAIKYSANHSEISIKIIQTNNTLDFIVVDQGLGITTEEQEQIFEMFYRGSASPNTEGSGLGLALVKNILHDLKGNITLTSQLNIGSTIHITFDLINNLKSG